MDLILDSLQWFGRGTLGGIIGFAIGWATQRQRHSYWVAFCTLLGYALGVATAWPRESVIVAAALLLIPAGIGLLAGWTYGVGTLRTRGDWYLRICGFAGALIFVQVVGVGAMAAVNAVSE